MIVRARVWIAAAIGLFLALTGTGSAQSSPAVIVIVADAASGAPVEKASVFLVAVTQEGNRVRGTDRSGTATFVDVPGSAYRLVVRAAGFQTATEQIDVAGDRITRLTVHLARALQQIGNVTARSSTSVAYETLSSRSPAVKMSKSLIDALGSLSGVEVLRGSDGIASGISLRGKDPSLTSYGFDGHQLANPLAGRVLDPDLLQSAQVDQSNDAVNFNLLQPTTQPTYGAVLTAGGFGLSKLDATAQGHVGALGYALQHIDRNLLSSLNGSVYDDTSGLSYRHDGFFHNLTDLAGLTAPLGSTWNLSVTAMRGRRLDQPVPAYFSGAVPFGIGPGNSHVGVAQNVIATATATYPAALVSIALSGGRSTVTDDARARFFDGQRAPLLAASNAAAQTLSLDVSLSDNRATNVHVTSTHAASRSTVSDGNAFASAPEVRTYGSSVTIFTASQVLKPSPTLEVKPRIGFEYGGGAALMASAQAAVGWKASARDRFDALLAAEAHAPNTFFEPGLAADVNAATYDCESRTALITGPNEEPSPVRSRRVEAGWTHTTARGSFSAALYNERYTGVTFSQAFVPAVNEPSLLPGAGLQSVLAGFERTGRCAGTLDADRVFLVHDVSGTALRYRGLNLIANRSFGNGLSVQLRYDVQSSSLIGAKAALWSRSSPYVPGAQLPGAPLQRMGLTAGYALPDRKTQMLVQTQYVAGNNANRLPPYLLLSFGTELRLSPVATLDVIATNVTHQYVGLFSSQRFAVPVSTAGDAPLLLNAAPLSQPEIFMRLNVKMSRTSF